MVTKQDVLLEKIISEINTLYHPHTIILYGSRARGDANETSDYDIIAICRSGQYVRDCRLFHGHYLDTFIYPEAQIKDQIGSLLRIKDGIVLFEENHYGNLLLDEVKKIYQQGPDKTPDWEKQEITVWLNKMLNRARVGDVEGNFRRHWLLHDLLECYFKLRNEWYLGPKESFQ